MSRFETIRDGQLCVLDYRYRDSTLQIEHVVVPDPVSGRGIAAELTEAALLFARRSGQLVAPRCSYAVAYIARNPQHQDLLED